MLRKYFGQRVQTERGRGKHERINWFENLIKCLIFFTEISLKFLIFHGRFLYFLLAKKFTAKV